MSTTQPDGGATGVPDPRGRLSSAGRTAWHILRETAIVLALAVVLSLLAKTFLVQSFYIPSASMNNTLVRDDRVIVSKLRPGPMELRRGDIVVFEDPGGWLDHHDVPPAKGGLPGRIDRVLAWVGLLPNDQGDHLIKRVVGLPGDHVVCCTADRKLLVNGQPAAEPYLFPGDDASDRTFDVTVPAGRLWVMGDHRSYSHDSRFQDGPANDGSAGSVPIDRVVGTAFAVVWPLPNAAWLGDTGRSLRDLPDAQPQQASTRSPSAAPSR